MVSDLVVTKVSNERLVAERHAQLVEAATVLFLRKGFHKTSVREIAGAVGWQMGTLYTYIQRKEDILGLICQAWISELWQGINDLPQRDTARETLEDACRHFFDGVDRMRFQVRFIYREKASLLPEQLSAVRDEENKQLELLASIIREGINRGEFRRVDVALTAENILMLGHMWSLRYWTLDQFVEFDSYVEKQLEFIFAGLT
jgi:AcrR family transcriptional regulator